MTTTTFSTCKCQHCSGKIEFETDHVGEMVECPHCKLETRLFVPPPSFKPKPAERTQPGLEGIPGRAVRWRWIAVGCVAALLLALVALIMIGSTARSADLPEIFGSTVGGVIGVVLFILLIVLAFFWLIFPWMVYSKLNSIEAILIKIERNTHSS